MKNSWMRWGAATVVTLVLAGCGGGGSNGSSSSAPSQAASLNSAIAAAARDAGNDSSVNTSAPFTAVQGIGVAAVTIKNGAPVVNFTVFDNGTVKTGLTVSNVSFAIAKLVPASNGDPARWVNYISRVEAPTGTNAVGSAAGGKPAMASALQATTDPKPGTNASQLTYNADGYYTYTFTANVTDPKWTQTISGTAYATGQTFAANATHRVAIQLSYVNADGKTVLVNPNFDFTLDASGKSVQVTDASQTRKVVDTATCNNCHDKLAVHGGGRVDTQYCVMCHNAGTTDANSGNVLTLSTLAHSIHAGKRLAEEGRPYIIWGYNASKNDFSDVGLPQDLRNCTTCHSAKAVKAGDRAVVATPQGDNWKAPSREACLTCHNSAAGSTWYTEHQTFNRGQDPNSTTVGFKNSDCARCHVAGTSWGADAVHFNQTQANAAKYKVNILSTSYDTAARAVTVKYNVVDPTNGNKAYNLVTSDCSYAKTAASPSGCQPASGSNYATFGNLRMLVAYQNLIGQPGPTEWTAYNNGGSTAAAYLSNGTNDGSNNYTVTIALPADSATAKAAGSARVFTYGQVKEAPLTLMAVEPRPVASSKAEDKLNVGVQHGYGDFAISGTLEPRRAIVSTEKCNVCHGMLGTASAANTMLNTTVGSSGANGWNAFHSGARNTVEACPVCHDPNRASTGNLMTDGSAYYESFQFKRFIHGIHGNSMRKYPFAHGNAVQGAFNKDGTPMAPWTTPMTATAENYAKEVEWPGAPAVNAGQAKNINCNACHVDGSYKADRSVVATLVMKPTGVTDPLAWQVISPKSATCLSCHNGTNAVVGAVVGHVTQWGGGSYGNVTQKQSWSTSERCDDCHAANTGFAGVDFVHGMK